jgi:hypothetical protein
MPSVSIFADTNCSGRYIRYLTEGADSRQAWKQDHAELAEHFYSQMETSHPMSDSALVEELTDLCYEIGNDQLHRNQSVEAAKWLKRGCQLTDRYKSKLRDLEMDELRLALLHTYGEREACHDRLS